MIISNEELKTFYLNTENTTYAFCVNEINELEHLYYGERISNEDLSHLRFRQTYNFSPYYKETGDKMSPDTSLQELSVVNSGDSRICALGFKDGNGIYGKRFKYISHIIQKGRKSIKGLPFSRGDDAESLDVLLRSEDGNIEVILHYVVFFDNDVITRYQEVKNCSDKTISIINAAVSLDIALRDFDLIDLFGSYHNERAIIQRTPLKCGLQGNFSHQGISGHETNPFMALCSSNATENCGEVYGFNLIYSGNFKNQVQVDKLGNTRVVSGISDYCFNWDLNQGEIFSTPEVVYTYTHHGIGQMSRNFHDFIREHIISNRFADHHRPVVLNTWESFNFEIDENKILDLAESAREIGAETIVVDDGWFRDHDAEGLGDWNVKTERFPSGIKELSNKLHQKGFQFGLWFEPEMVNEDSEVFKTHPEWVLKSKEGGLLWRNQFVLDMSNPNVVDYMFSRFCDLLDDVKIEYIKWDMNRYISEADSLYTINQGEVFHRYIMGVYELLRRVTERYPDALFETCAGGGGRFDLGMLYYSPQIWTSDNTDPYLRTNIQIGTSIAYPCSSMSCHYTASKVSGLDANAYFRFSSAAFGVYGYELDPKKLTNEEKKQLKEFTKECKSSEEVMLKGDLYRLMNYTDGTLVSYIQVSKDKSKAIFTFIQYFYTVKNQRVIVRLQGLDSNAFYHCSLDGKNYRGDILMKAGFEITGIMYKSGMSVRVYFDQIIE